jgi:Zn-dependent protease with chaperone function
MAKWFASHPPTQKRIERLEEFAKKSGNYG